MKLRKFVELTKMSLEYEYIDCEDKAYQYEIVIKFKRRKARFKYFIGIGLNRDPEIEMCLNTIQLDCQSINYDSFEDWCYEIGYDPDSRKAYESYKECLANTKKMKKLLGETLFEQFMTCEE